MLRAGELTERADILAKQRTPDVGPGQTVTWLAIPDGTDVPFRIRAAATRPLARLAGGAQTEAQLYDVTCRYRTDVTTSHRLAWDGRVLQIHGVVDPDGSRLELALSCSEV